MAKPAAICQMPATMHIGKIEMAHQTPNNMATEIKKVIVCTEGEVDFWMFNFLQLNLD
jgi:regulation of enolase protein 1 (concanavalin A-like superfamily)